MTYVDSDWAGCKVTRKSTSAGALTWGGSLLESWSRSQGTPALSSGEAEFFAVIKGAAESIGVQSLLADMGMEAKIELISDSTAAKGIASRIGVGKIKHLGVAWLWIQGEVKSGRIAIRKINGKVHLADLMTKPKSAAEAVRLSEAIGYGLTIRGPGSRGGGDFVGFVRHIMKGSRDDAEGKMETQMWWMEKMWRKWYEKDVASR